MPTLCGCHAHPGRLPRPPCAAAMPTLGGFHAHPVRLPCPPCAAAMPTLGGCHAHPVRLPCPPWAAAMPTLCGCHAHPARPPCPPCAAAMPTLGGCHAHPGRLPCPPCAPPSSAPRDALGFQGSRTAFGRLAFLGLGRGRGHKGGGGNGDGAVRRVLALGGRGATSARILDVGNVPSSAELGAAATLPAGLTLTRTDVHPRPYVGRGERVWMSSRVGRIGLLGRCSHVVACGV
ncbi:unnamed protein product [Citrullus colocynthis]|uniref:Uncharacterized protein n=1 Tax=Citrullus colocynthis TaxID=252529 RepID=A0ABP0YFI8_9ROSI